MKTVEVFTDGGCRGNPGPGGWGAVLLFGEHERELKGSEDATTNNRMELLAAISALEALSESCRVVLTTDSTYVKDGITKWIRNWKANGWRTAAKKPVKNQDLWQKLDAECAFVLWNSMGLTLKILHVHTLEARWEKRYSYNYRIYYKNTKTQLFNKIPPLPKSLQKFQQSLLGLLLF